MKIDKVREIGGGRYELTLIPSLYFAREGNKDQNHFPIDEKTGEHVALFNDKERTKAIIIFGESDIIKTKEGNGVALIFNIKDTTEVRKAGNTFSAIFSNGFTEKVKMINEISVNNEKYYTPNPLKIPYIPMYLDNVGHWLEYLKNVFGFDFKQYVYNEFCKRILNYRVNYESGLYSGEIPQTHINAVKIWIESQDKIIQREAEFFKYSKISDSQHKTKQHSIEIPVLKANTKDKEKAESILIVLSGRWLNGEKIMTDDEYKKVIEGVNHLIDSGQVKPIDRKVKTSASMQFLRRLFREVNTELYGKGIKDCFIEFLHTYFECFNKSEPSTTKNNFKEYRNGDFNTHYTQITESIKVNIQSSFFHI